MSDSFLDELREIRQHVLKQSVKELTVPGSAQRIMVRYRPPVDTEMLREVVAAYRTNQIITAEQEQQLIVDCCDEILRKNGTGEYESHPDGPLRFDGGDERWGDDVKTARDCVAKLYNLDKQPIATSGHVLILIPWLQGLDAEVASRVEGKSESGADS